MARKTIDDPELKAMAVLVEAMDPLDGDQRDRVREWFVARYGEISESPPHFPNPRSVFSDKLREEQDGRPAVAEP